MKINMPKIMKNITIISIIMFLVFAPLNVLFGKGWMLSTSITFATITYHFSMRLCVGYAFDKVMDNKANYTRKWYRVCSTELKLYELIKVKKWKKNIPSYNPDLFSADFYVEVGWRILCFSYYFYSCCFN